MTDKEIAQAAGFYIRQGEFVGTTDNRLGRWYVGRESEPFRPWGAGFDRAGKAWARAGELARELAS